MDKLTIRDIDVKDKRVLVRVDFNVPMNEDTGVITDDSRIRASINRPFNIWLTTKLKLFFVHIWADQRVLRKTNSDSHRLRKDYRNWSANRWRLPVIVLDRKPRLLPKRWRVVIFYCWKNLRFHAEEEKNEPVFSKALASLADIYVNDAFGTAHRAHASIVGVTKYLQPAVAGFLLEKELVHLGGILTNPVHPFAALLGGAKS